MSQHLFAVLIILLKGAILLVLLSEIGVTNVIVKDGQIVELVFPTLVNVRKHVWDVK